MNEDNKLIHLIYVSSATKEMYEEDLMLLLETCRSHNQRQNITGMLLYMGGNFMQVLEGAKKDVEEAYERIIKDDRNTGNIILVKKEIIERTFPGWFMGFKHLSAEDSKEIPGYTEFLNKEMAPKQIANHLNAVVTLLYHFKRNNLAM